MLLSVLPAAAWATDNTVKTFHTYLINPLSGIDPSAVEKAAEEYAAEAAPANPVSDLKAATYVSEDTAIRQIRDAMLRRENDIAVYVTRSSLSQTPEDWAIGLVQSAYSMSYAEGITDGDYLQWSFAYVLPSGTYKGQEFALTYKIRYYTTYEQEQQVSAAMYATVANLNLGGTTDYAKVQRIYQFITEHVTYDYDGLNAMYEQQRLSRDELQNDIAQHFFLPYTAYAALMNGTSVCQGYATLFYAMCRIAGVPVRVITSSDHAWNIVCLNGVWYNADATFDSSTLSHSDYFLKNANTFNDGSHVREYPFNTAAFEQSYPVSSTDYVSRTRYWDVDNNSYHVANIERVSELGLMNGIDEGRPMFGPMNNMQRSMLVTVLYRIEGKPAVSGSSGFSDVPGGQWYSDAVNWAAKNGIVNGYEDGSFKPQNDLTRQELIKILYEYSRYKQLDTSKVNDLSVYTDRSEVTWALPAVSWSVGSGIVMGTEATVLSPAANAPREQLATILARYLDYYPSVLAA